MSRVVSFHTERGDPPAMPIASDVALEASVTLERAQAVIAASWAMAEAFTGRWYWPVTSAALVVSNGEDTTIRWPRWPFPETVEVFDTSVNLVPLAAGTYDWNRHGGFLTGVQRWGNFVIQTGPITPPAPGPHVVEAVRCLALYALIHSAARREFKNMQAGDSTLTREATGPLMAASGAGALLRGECQWV